MKRVADSFSRWSLVVFIGAAALMAVLLLLAPVERTLGQLIKLVYLHGALVRIALLWLALSVVAHGVALATRRDDARRWGRAMVLVAAAIWLLHTLVSMVTTYAAWGVWVAWFEPRTRFTFLYMAVLLIAFVVVYALDDELYGSGVFLLVAALPLILAPRLGVIQHPLDPIGTSPSTAIRLFYVAVLICAWAASLPWAVWAYQRVDGWRL
ncbi:MAG: hypothetical protein Kow0047_27180 [Anaerolineae bacterium]